MCGRFALYQEKEQLAKTFLGHTGTSAVAELDSWTPSYSVTPTSATPIVRAESGDRRFELSTWGWQRQWVKRPLINARAEKLLERTWKKGFLIRRAMVPMDGYFEWVDTATGKQPYYITGTNLAAAALYDYQEDRSFVTVITAPGVDAAGTVHDRMPVFLAPAIWDEWLAGDVSDDDGAQLRDVALASSQDVARSLEVWPVSQNLNNARTARQYGESLIEPVDVD